MVGNPEFSEERTRAGLARLLSAVVEVSGRTRCDIAADAGLHKDALRRVLQGDRSATLGEALRILDACHVPARGRMLLFIMCNPDHALTGSQSDLVLFFERFIGELPIAMSHALGDRASEVRPTWAKGAAHRLALLLSDHVDQLRRQEERSFAVQSAT